jgi:hypothetical protein
VKILSLSTLATLLPTTYAHAQSSLPEDWKQRGSQRSNDSTMNFRLNVKKFKHRAEKKM